MVATVLDPHVVAAAGQDRAILAALDSLLTSGVRVRLVSGATSVDMPAGLLDLLAQCVRSLEQDQPVTLLPLQRMLSPEEAADLLNVPRANVRRLLAVKELPVIEVDGEPRIRADHLLAYYARRTVEQQEALAELVALGQEIDPEPAIR